MRLAGKTGCASGPLSRSLKNRYGSGEHAAPGARCGTLKKPKTRIF